MTQSQRQSDGPVVNDNGVCNARRASGKPKSNATSFKKGRKKTGGRKIGTPNRTTGFLREAMLIGGEAAGDELGGNGIVSYFNWIALNHPTGYISLLGRWMTQQLEPEQTSPPKEEVVFNSAAEIREYLMSRGVPPDHYARALLGEDYTVAKKEQSGTDGPTSSTDEKGEV